ncbi:MAG: flagellar motor protein MotB [Proteobacteria bacterium]|nr:flagellar motor protein MotB [Pseudomonadota bacterium]MBU0965762.1 flagellar motor protein MotB [Pseudomonadota bacterium]MBU4295094.1 flagellar motor protein MotB [Pseudomonadota bacterium]MCG2746697.1 flagellar motor protein MotB [Desulfobulbaceae bacterium]
MAKEEPKKVECPPGAPLWMCTFSDMMSLLLCFFILLLSFSVMDAQRYQEIAGSMKDAFGTQKEKVEPLSLQGQKMISTSFDTVPLQVQMKVAKVFSDEIEGGVVDSDYSETGLILRVKGGVAFESGSAQIKNEFLPFLDKLGKLAEEMDLSIEVSGHTDNILLKKGVTPFHSNWELSAARAVGVVEYWNEKMKIPPERLLAIAAADGRPLALNDTPEGRAANRRVEFRIRPANPKVVVPGIELDKEQINKVTPEP